MLLVVAISLQRRKSFQNRFFLTRLYFIVFLLCFLPQALSAQINPESIVKHKYFDTYSLRVSLSNDGRLYSGAWGISFSTEQTYYRVWDHGLVLLGYRDGQLVGTAPLWSPNYTPGPIIDGQAAIQVAPEDSALYRTYLLTTDSQPDDPDYDEWPRQWGAPVTNMGAPKLHGDKTAWTVYNDAYPGLHSWIEESTGVLTNTNIEIRETVWGYDRPGLLGQTVFFKWQLFNKSDQLDSVVVGIWNDIDFHNDYPCFDAEHGIGYIFSPSEEPGQSAVAASYALLQGPLVPAADEQGVAFGRQWPGYKNMPTTAYWAILDDSYPATYIGGAPDSLQQLYNFLTGRRHDGSPIVNPINGDTTSYTFTGNPVTQTGWSQKGSGGCSQIPASGPFTLAPGDSQEVVYALIYSTGESNKITRNQLLVNFYQIRDFYRHGIEIPTPEEPKQDYFRLRNPVPNPLTQTTNIGYSVAVTADVSLEIYNLRGQWITTLRQRLHEPGEYSVTLSSDDLPGSGIYFCRLNTPYGTSTKKLTFIHP